MKKITILFIFSLCCFVTACEDLIDMTPENSLTFYNAFDKENEVEAAMFATESFVRIRMAGMNGFMPSQYGMYQDYFDPNSTSLLQQHSPALYRANWSYPYSVITSANVPLPFIDDVDMAKERKDYYKGQIAFFKAFAYYDLICNFGDCILVKDDVLFKPAGKSRWPVVADYAIEQAELAIALLPEHTDLTDASGNPVTHRARPCKGAARAVLAHLCAWKAGSKYMAQPEDRNYDETELWEKTEQACTEIIDRSDIYSLEPTPEEVCTKTFIGGGKEVVYESVLYNIWNEIGSMWSSRPFAAMSLYSGYPVQTNTTAGSYRANKNRIENETVREMFPEYNENGTTKVDKRRDAWFYDFEALETESETITGGYAYPYKARYAYEMTSGSYVMFNNFNINRTWWRLADIILLRAECRARLGKNSEAITDLNMIRTRAGAKLYDASEYGGDLRYTIYKEREKELLMEGHRWRDVVRNGYYKTELFGGFREVSDQDILDGVFFCGIDLQAFTDNPLMRQNTYWLKRE